MASDAQAFVPTVEIGDIQATILRPRPSPYKGEYVVLNVADPVQGRDMLRRILPHVAPADSSWAPSLTGWLSVAFTFSGLRAIGLSNDCLESFPLEFREGMAARATVLGDTGENSPDRWEYPFGSTDAHVLIAIYAKDETGLEAMLERARQSHHDLPAIEVLYRLPFSELPDGRNPFGFKDGLHNPRVEGASGVGPLEDGPVLKAGEIVLGYPDEDGRTATTPSPDILRRNGAYVAVRKFHTKVAEFRRYLRENSSSPDEEELLAAKMVGRWRSGAPLVLAPDRDDAALGADPERNNRFGYANDDKGLACPFSAHIRRVNPRDALKDDIVAVDRHQFIRRGTNFGAPLPEGVTQDDGVDRGGVFLLIGTDLGRQFEFVQSQWIANGNFIGHGQEQDPLLGNSAQPGDFTIPRRPIRRRLHGLPQFAAVRGGEYCFMPGLRALRWLSELSS
ncbi:Dyp-type peroxidase [Sphingomonas sp. UYP23]